MQSFQSTGTGCAFLLQTNWCRALEGLEGGLVNFPKTQEYDGIDGLLITRPLAQVAEWLSEQQGLRQTAFVYVLRGQRRTTPPFVSIFAAVLNERHHVIITGQPGATFR